MRLSLCIATFNEEQNIHYPLDSAYDLVDEVIIVDGGSTDKTVAKAKSYGKKIKVFIEDNPPMFHINKQKAIERAKGEWILQLDADEALSDELKREIKEIIRRNFQFPISNFQTNPKSKIQKIGGTSEVEEESRNDVRDKLRDGKTSEVKGDVAYWIPRKNFFLSRFLTKGGQYPDYTIRLYRNGFARFPCRDVHENVTIDTSIVIPSERSESRDPHNKKDFSTYTRNDMNFIGYLINPILHYADPDFSRYLKRWDRYTTLEADQLRNNKQLTINNLTMLDYFFFKPARWFFLTYFRHLGFLDGFPGFVFALFSSIRFWAIYIKLWKLEMRR